MVKREDLVHELKMKRERISRVKEEKYSNYYVDLELGGFEGYVVVRRKRKFWFDRTIIRLSVYVWGLDDCLSRAVATIKALREVEESGT